MAGVFWGPQLPGVKGPQNQEGSCFKLCPIQGEGLGCHSASSDSLPLDSPWDLEQITSPGFVKSWD